VFIIFELKMIGFLLCGDWTEYFVVTTKSKWWIGGAIVEVAVVNDWWGLGFGGSLMWVG